MALTDLIRKRDTGKSANAFPANPANREGRTVGKLAGLARLAVARPEDAGTDASKLAGLALANLNAAEVGILEKLRQFRFDLVNRDIEGGYSAADLERVNNLTWELMRADGMDFSAALHLAAQIVAECDVAASERAYEDVRALWHRLTRNLD